MSVQIFIYTAAHSGRETLKYTPLYSKRRDAGVHDCERWDENFSPATVLPHGPHGRLPAGLGRVSGNTPGYTARPQLYAYKHGGVLILKNLSTKNCFFFIFIPEQVWNAVFFCWK